MVHHGDDSTLFAERFEAVLPEIAHPNRPRAARSVNRLERPPGIGGFNRFAAKADSATLLETQRYCVSRVDEELAFEPAEREPLLVVGTHGRGRVAALATDVAPHWVGGLVDWGPSRVAAQAPGAEAIEVGNLYSQFFWQLLQWTGNL